MSIRLAMGSLPRILASSPAITPTQRVARSEGLPHWLKPCRIFKASSADMPNPVKKKARRQDLISKKVVSDAVKGDVKSAEMLLNFWEHLKRNTDVGTRTIRIRNWLHDYPGQTAEQKTHEFRMNSEAEAPEWWKKVGDEPAEDGS